MGRKRYITTVFLGFFVFFHLFSAFLIVFQGFVPFTSGNSVVYVLRGERGGIELSRDLILEDADRLIFMMDASCVFNYFMRGLAMAKRKPILELTWDAQRGSGDVKQYREDGTELSLAFSRYKMDFGRPKGLFLGGDLSYGDISRSEGRGTSGFGYYDGRQWYHIWCALNEAFKLSGQNEMAYPPFWRYLGSNVLKNTEEEVILRSEHEVDIGDVRFRMKRFVSFRAGEDYFTLKVRITNANTEPVVFDYAVGDEPWIGNYGSSDGDVGWYEDGLVEYEGTISPLRYKYAGFWDRGNWAAGEDADFSGYANFVEWLGPAPSYVYFSNSFENCCLKGMPLSSRDTRVINIVWINQMLLPGQSRDFAFAIGMAGIDEENDFPAKPLVISSD